MTIDSHSKLVDIYRRSNADVRARGLDLEMARRHYGDYVSFVRATAPAAGNLLDIGCGNGWSSFLFTELAYRTTGVDLNSAFFEPAEDYGLCFREASALDLPFDAESFDIVAANQMLEHIPSPETALREMLRVLKPGGLICIVGPNLISPLQSLRGIFRYVWRNRPVSRIFRREAGMPRHPCGNTLPEAVSGLVSNLGRIALRMVASTPRFELREPDLIPPFHSDNDACYLCNPLDLKKFFEKNNCTVIRNGKNGRHAAVRYFAAGTWLAVRKQPGLTGWGRNSGRT